MSLPYDYARCVGVKYPLCTDCRRREPGSEHWQAIMSPPFNWDKRTCHYYIAPLAPVVKK